MSITTLPAVEMFRTLPARRDVQGVDREKGRILGASVMELGSVNDARPWDIDDEALNAVVAFGNEKAKGVKARFTHPMMSSDGLGTYLGRWSNFRRDGNAVRADLQIADVAFKSPKGDIGTYVMDLAEEDPEAFGNSAALRLDLKAMDKLKAKDGRTKLRMQGLRAVDVVDDPAATRSGMFSLDADDPRDIPAVVCDFLDTHFAGATPDVIRGRLNGLLSRYFDLRGLSMADQNATLASKKTEEQDPGRTREPNEPIADPAKTPEPTVTPNPGSEPASQPNTNGNHATQDNSAALAAERKRVQGIYAVCSLAKVPQAKVNEFIEKETALSDVNVFCANYLSNTNVPVPADPEGKDADDPDAQFKAEYREHCGHIAKLGMTPCSEADFIRSRKIDAGLIPLSKAV
jgi:hypothetical protein